MATILTINPNRTLLVAKILHDLAEEVEAGLLKAADLKSPECLVRCRLSYGGEFECVDNVLADFLDPTCPDVADALPKLIIDACEALEALRPSSTMDMSDEERTAAAAVLFRCLMNLVLEESFGA